MSSSTQNTRRRLIYFALIVFGLVFGGRLFHIQVISGGHYKALAQAEQLRKFEIPADRGIVYIQDNGEKYPLVLNQNYRTVFADPRYIESPEHVALELSKILGGKAEEYVDLVSQPEKVYVVIAKNVEPEKADRIEKLELAGVGFQDSPKRVYPEGSLASQILGFVNDEGAGQYGIEGILDEELSGTPGMLRAVTDTRGIPLTTSDSENIEQLAKDGTSVVLTIDRSVQQAVENAVKEGVERIGGKSGSAIVLDPKTGAIIAMANYPTYDPAKFFEVENQEYFGNDVISDAYEPGSVMKPFTMAAGLQTKAVAPSTTFYDSGSVQIDDRTIYNAEERSWGQRDMNDVIRLSINTGVVFVVQQLGGGEINDKARNSLYNFLTNNYRFGARLGIAQPNENPGLIYAPDHEQGNNVRYSNMAFGQGMTATMLQISSSFAALVNGGDYYQPRLIHSRIDGDTGEEVINEPQIISNNAVTEEVAKQVRSMLISVVESGGGYYAKRAGYTIGGKTGTSQLIEPDGTYSTSRYTGSFVGFISSGGTSDTPDYVVMTRVVEPKVAVAAGADAAAPVFGDIADFLIDHYQIAPNR